MPSADQFPCTACFRRWRQSCCGPASLVIQSRRLVVGSALLLVAINLHAASSDTASGTGTLTINVADTFNITNLQITGTSTIDFSAGVAATLDGTNSSISSGLPTAALSIANWVNGVDYSFAQNWTNAMLNVTDVAPTNQVSFAVSNSSYAASNTAWLAYGSTFLVTPAPEATSYGAILMGLSLAGFVLRRRRASRRRIAAGEPLGITRRMTALTALSRNGIL